MERDCKLMTPTWKTVAIKSQDTQKISIGGKKKKMKVPLLLYVQ